MSTPQKSKGKRRSAPEWVEAALQALMDGGVEAVRVEPLAAKLGVTKGSFYWHFEDRAALLAAVLEAWEQRTTRRIIELVDAEGAGPRERLLRLLALTSHPSAHRLEGAVRAWGHQDPAAKVALARVDGDRERYVSAILVEAGVPKAEAKRRTRGLYLMLIGGYTWRAHGGQPIDKAVWNTMVNLILR
ncbi:MAG: TetR/AcrR family transcriptional regulator [Myxococcota bacterium]